MAVEFPKAPEPMASHLVRRVGQSMRDISSSLPSWAIHSRGVDADGGGYDFAFW